MCSLSMLETQALRSMIVINNDEVVVVVVDARVI
jgi:hypothetical protein